jgi:SAM-dependent methyltransferase
VGWVIDLTGVTAASRVLDIGCGNGAYLDRLQVVGASAIGCDMSMGMLRSSVDAAVVNADAQALPFPARSFDVVLAAHMLYHVADRELAVNEMRRVLVPGGTCVAVTNGSGHIGSLRQLVESAVHERTPGWKMIDWATRAFSLDEGMTILRTAFDSVTCVRPPIRSEVVITDPGVVSDYVASVAAAYQHQVGVPWGEIVEQTRQEVQAIIDREGAFITAGDTGAFVCR